MLSEDDPPTGHTVVVPFGMDEHFVHHNELFRPLVFVHVVLCEDDPVGVESGLENVKSSYKCVLCVVL